MAGPWEKYAPAGGSSEPMKPWQKYAPADHVHPDDLGPALGDQTTTDAQGHIVPVNPMAQGAPAPDPAKPAPATMAPGQPDEWSHPTLVPLQHNRKTGAWRLGDSEVTKSLTDAVTLPNDALQGKYPELDPGQGLGNLSPALIGRTLNFATMTTGGEALPKVVAPGPLKSLGSDAAGSFGIPLTRGQSSGDLQALTKEENLRQGAGAPSNIMRNFDAAQREKIVGAADNIGLQLGTRPESMTDSVVSSIQNKVAFHKDQTASLYQIAADGDAAVKREMVQALPQIVNNSLETAAVTVDPQLTPGANAAMRILEDAGKMQGGLSPTAGKGAGGAPAGFDGVSLQGLEQVRKKLVNLGDGANPTDGRAIKAIKKAYDDWMQSAVDNMLVSGDDQALEALKQARKASGEYLRITSPDAGDAAGAAVAKMQKGDSTAEEVANWLYGADVAAPTLNAPKVAAKVKDLVGADSDAWNAVRASAWERLTKDAATGDLKTNLMVAKRIETFLNAKGTTLSNVLYSPEERAQMQKFADALKTTVTPRDATNPSRSAHTLAAGVNAIYRTIVGGFVTALTGGNAMAGVGTALAMPVFKNIGARKAALKAVAGIVPEKTAGPIIKGTPLGGAKTGLTYLGSEGSAMGANDNGLAPSVKKGGTMSLNDWVKQQEAAGKLAV